MLDRLGRRGMLLGAAALAGCQTAPTTPEVLAPRITADGTGYILFQAPIAERSRDLFIEAIGQLVTAKATAIEIFINSLGGEVKAAQDMEAAIERLRDRNIRVTTHNVGAVASAACYVFLAGQRRRSVRGGSFLFHQTSVVGAGTLTSQALKDLAAQVEKSEREMSNLLTTRTRITAAEATSFVRRTVILSADEALRDGVIDSIGPAIVPGGLRSSVIATRPPATRTAPTTTAAPSGQ